MKRTRPGMKQINLWMTASLHAALKEYQHQQRLDSLTEAVDQLLRAGLTDAGVSVAE